MKWSQATLIFLLFACSLNLRAQTPPTTSQQPDIEVLRVSTSLVIVPAIVKTRQGAYVPNLSRQDFRIYEDGVEQEISSFETVDKPFTVALMLDVSDSTRRRLVDIQNAAIAFLNHLRPEDRALIVAFDKQYSVLTEVTSDRKVLSDAIRRVKTGGGTVLYDAIDTIINTQLKQIPGRKAIVILTDGVDATSERATYESTLGLATEQYALIYPIQYGTPNDVTQPNAEFGLLTYSTPSGEPISKAYERGTRYLQSLALTSGGRFHNSVNLKSLEHSLARIAEELRQQYSLSYYPKDRNPRNGKRRIKVIVSAPDALVHSRASYAYKPDSR